MSSTAGKKQKSSRDLPRYKCISQYENKFKRNYVKNLDKALSLLLKELKNVDGRANKRVVENNK